MPAPLKTCSKSIDNRHVENLKLKLSHVRVVEVQCKVLHCTQLTASSIAALHCTGIAEHTHVCALAAGWRRHAALDDRALSLV